MPSLSLGLRLLHPAKHKAFSGWNGSSFYINGELTNLDQYGSSYFNIGPDNQIINNALYYPGDFSSWDNLFYQNATPFTGDLQYSYYWTDTYGPHLLQGTKHFINGVNV